MIILHVYDQHEHQKHLPSYSHGMISKIKKWFNMFKAPNCYIKSW